ncbi:MAG: RNA polymerase sigma factor [Lachnospiraceae bacterium]|nr:RNA polymerase sigma factor [Lachnospiraceae bacterium]
MAALDYNYMAELVVNAQSGNSDAFAELYAATYQKQYRFAYSYLKDEYLAQDALQETYIIALKELSKLKDPMLLVAWLNQINFRVCFQLHKRQKRYDAEMAGDYSDEEGDWEQASGVARMNSRRAEINNPEEVVIQVDSREYIMNQILKLPFTEAQVILLRFYRNLKYDEIAELLEISKSSVKRYLNSGKEHLGNVLRQQGGGF